MTRSKRRHSDKDMRAIFRALERDHGCTVECSGHNHWKISREGVYLLMASGSGDRFAVAQVRRDLRRYHGIEV